MDNTDTVLEGGGKKVAAKPALKKHTLQHYNNNSNNVTTNDKDDLDVSTDSTVATGSKKKGTLKWDEEAIAEHDQLRGTRMKIDEPNTPFHYDSGAESDGSHNKSPSRKRPTIDFDLLQDKLTNVAFEASACCPPSPSSNSQGDSSVDEEKKRQFREHRKKHYNEMDRVRQFRNSNGDSFDDSMDDDEQNEDHDHDHDDENHHGSMDDDHERIQGGLE